jgi:hypothetical protein
MATTPTPNPVPVPTPSPSPFKGYRTLALFLAVTIIGALQGFNWVQVIPNNPQLVGGIVSGLGIIGMFLRSITTTSIGSSS